MTNDSRTVEPGKHAIAPLPFDATKLTGMSEKMLVSHHANNYGGAVRNLNRVEEELERVTTETPAFVIGGLKERELTFSNSMALHELYFANLGGNGRASGIIEKRLADRYGTLARWEELFRATGMSLGGGSGWAILAYDHHARDLRTVWSGHHSQVLAMSEPLLVMDLYEHSYQMDYGAEVASYINAFFQNVKWEEVNRRFEHAQRVAAV